MNQVHFGKNLRHLVPKEFESHLLGSRIYTAKSKGWSAEVRKKGLLFDLSRVEWVDLGVLVQLTLLVESALRNKIEVTVALPLPRARKSEENWMQSNPDYSASVKRRIEKRYSVKEYLRYLQFDSALRPEHLGDLRTTLKVIEDFDPADNSVDDYQVGDTSDPKESEGSEQSQREDLYRYCFPLTWLSSNQTTKFQPMAKFLASAPSLLKNRVVRNILKEDDRGKLKEEFP